MNKENTPLTVLSPSKEVAETFADIPFFDWKNYKTWGLGFSIPALISLGIIPLAKFFTHPDYSGWFSDVFSNMGILMISLSMAIAAKFRLDTRRQIPESSKANKKALKLNHALLGIMGFTFIVYSATSLIGLYRPVLPERVIWPNFSMFVFSFICGTLTFLRGFSWK